MLKIETGKLSAKGVVAIPVKVRNLLGIGEGDRLLFEERGDEIVVKGVKRKSILDAYGSLKIDFKEPLVDVRDVRDQVREELIADDLHRQGI
ncbi:AbrB/MazE/SpoVT family DNA-binding domain-containing protein [Paenibacillaceae bacterium WGS1546]|uniref:AbrB/MazE/SpoVT family DNA-binding domain-containing protein n=1 Tax=Cohnella sp. WGS1546 TaxID=3366810 RepID=UPI00372D5B8B